MKKHFLCSLCNQLVSKADAQTHKEWLHFQKKHYGIMWPLYAEKTTERDLWDVPIYESSLLAQELRVAKVYIRDEGQNFSGSMKDYIVERAVKLGIKQGRRIFTVVSSGNHAISLAKYTERYNSKAVVFTPASSSKIELLSSFANVLVVGVKEAIFEEAFAVATNLNLEGIYNANVNNELLLPAFQEVALQIAKLNPAPTHILAGVGNGSYLAGIGAGSKVLGALMPKIIPVGMLGAFPTETAFRAGEAIAEYDGFLTEEPLIDAAEGSIAIASYSMPQLMMALRLSKGFPLGLLTNDDLRTAYLLLAQEKSLIAQGAVPEPTGIMGLAAAIKHKKKWAKSDVLLISFTGHGVKDCEGIKKLAPEIAAPLISQAMTNRPDLMVVNKEKIIKENKVLLVEKNSPKKELEDLINQWIERSV